MPRPIASLSLDLDNRWSYMKTHGESGWETFPSYLDVVVPRVLDFFAAREQRITFFVVGQDAALAKNEEAIAAIAAAGHEIGNHSFRHEPWLHLYTQSELEHELGEAHEQLVRVTGQSPSGFRGPGFSISPTTLRVLTGLGYAYDASTFPTFLGPVARAYYFWTARLTADQRRQRRQLFGRFQEGFRPLRPFVWELAEGSLVEIPVTTMPGLRLPFHLSYVLYLAARSKVLALNYFRTALACCRISGVAPSLLLHPLDFLGRDDSVGLDFFPAMSLRWREKLALVDAALSIFSTLFRPVHMSEHCRCVSRQKEGTVPLPDRTRGQLVQGPNGGLAPCG